MLSAPQPDEVVEVFTGDTLEEAMAYAVATLGPDLTVRRARRVRKGVQGLRGKEKYEVVAVPAPHVSSDVVGNAFEALLNQAEEDEGSTTPTPVRRTTRPADSGTEPVVLEAVPELIPVPVAHPAAPAIQASVLPPRPVLEPPSAPAARPTTPARPAARRAPAKAPAAARPRPAAAPAARRTEVSGWSRASLARLGLPKSVLSALPARDPKGDLAWAAALTKAFASVLPAADPDGAVVVNGVGLEGVLGILAAARKGMTPGTITYGGRTAPATATELALAVRAEVLR